MALRVAVPLSQTPSYRSEMIVWLRPCRGGHFDWCLLEKRRGGEGPKRHHCQHCDKSFTTSGYLKIHQRVHTGENLHNCDQCGAVFTQHSDLNRHKRIHTGEKLYSCDKCGAAFTRQGSLKIHQRIHTGEKL
ncbi:zinc finger protein 709-like [Perca flavescens]|uniref:zinc finger protein 709-like n=1 Tax=Perca flavescens TaxID=8167 RepID=UPI00106E4343|nr:zinc finger protein 709-like [Perca flavescens]